MPHYVVQKAGCLIQNGRPCKAGEVIELPAHVAEEFGPEKVLPEGVTSTPKPAAAEGNASEPAMPPLPAETHAVHVRGAKSREGGHS